MTLYEVEFDLDEKYMEYDLDLPESIDPAVFQRNLPLRNNWKWPRFDKEGGRKSIKADFVRVTSIDQLLIMEEAVWQLVNKPLIASGQCYVVKIGCVPHHISFPWHMFRGGWKEEGDGKNFWVDPKAFRGQYPLFQIEHCFNLFALSTPELRREGLDFEYLVRENHLSGLTFKKEWESAD